MKIAPSLLIATVALSACRAHTDGAVATVQSAADATERHVDAHNCEIFIDKVAAFRGSHAALSFVPFVKILKDRLDGEVVEVGFRNQLRDANHMGSSAPSRPWENRIMDSYSPVGDYWGVRFGLNVASDFGSGVYEGVFYVKTSSGSYYWAKPEGGGNFVFGSGEVHAVLALYDGGDSYSDSPERAIPTQNRPEMGRYNPQRCY